MRCSKYLALECALLFAFAAVQSLNAQSASAASADFFETKIRPILADNCYGCHTNSAMGGLRLDSLDAMKKGGKHGPVVTSGDPEKSLLIAAVKQADPELRMPKGGKLKPAQIADLEAWIKAGAVWPQSKPVNASNTDGKYVISAERRNFWSFQPLKPAQPPPVKDEKWVKTDIDRFILTRLEKDGMKPVRPAG
jgi:mono/diheme cytochrome c family protein